KHKSSEKMNANLKTRYIKLKEKIETLRKTSKGAKKVGIKKEEMQAVILGFTGSGKSSLISILTNTKPEIAPYDFTTKYPIVGMMPFSGTQIQIIEVPAVKSEFYDRGLSNGADTILLLVNKIEDIDKLEKEVGTIDSTKIVVFNNKYDLDERKIDSTLRSKKLNYVIINTETGSGLTELKEKMFKSFGRIRVFTKEPGKPKSDKPIVLYSGSTVKDVAEKIFHGFSKQVKETFVTGPSSKFPNQKTGLTHKLKDLDIVEFKTK
ncbi:MAG: GTPase, partial [Nanoarchaeota archaeon]